MGRLTSPEQFGALLAGLSLGFIASDVVPPRTPGKEGRYYQFAAMTPAKVKTASGWFADMEQLVPVVSDDMLSDVAHGTPLVAVQHLANAHVGWVTVDIHLAEQMEQRQESPLATIYVCDVEVFEQAMAAA